MEYMKSALKKIYKNYYIKDDKLYLKKNKYKNKEDKWVYEPKDFYVP